MSYGEPTLLPDYGRFVDLVDEVTILHPQKAFLENFYVVAQFRLIQIHNLQGNSIGKIIFLVNPLC